MKAQDIEDVLNVSAILAPIWTDDAPSLASLVATLIDWRDSSKVVATVAGWPDEGTTAKPKAKRGKAATRDPDFEPSPDPSVTSDTDEF